MRLIVVDEEDMFSEALVVLLARRGHDVVRCVPAHPDVFSYIQRFAPDLCVVTARSGTSADVDLVRDLRREVPGVGILVLGSDGEDASLPESLSGFADGFALKLDSGEEIERIMLRCVGAHDQDPGPHAVISRSFVAAARQRSSGRRAATLTPKERRVLELLVAGASTPRIAAELGVGEATIRTHLQHLFSKYGVHSRLALVAHAVRSNIIGPGDVTILPRAS